MQSSDFISTQHIAENKITIVNSWAKQKYAQ